MNSNFINRYSLLMAVFLVICSKITLCQQMSLSVEEQAPLLLKILSFDRTLKTKSADNLTIGVLYQDKFRTSKMAANEFVSFLKDNNDLHVNKLKVKCVLINLADLNDQKATTILQNVDAFYIAPLRAFDIYEITKISRAKKIATMSGVPEYINAGISIGLDLVAEHPKILININSAKSEGIEFNSQLLKLAEVIE